MHIKINIVEPSEWIKVNVSVPYYISDARNNTLSVLHVAPDVEEVYRQKKWCDEHVEINSWLHTGNAVYFYFEADAVAFKLRFGEAGGARY